MDSIVETSPFKAYSVRNLLMNCRQRLLWSHGTATTQRPAQLLTSGTGKAPRNVPTPPTGGRLADHMTPGRRLLLFVTGKNLEISLPTLPFLRFTYKLPTVQVMNGHRSSFIKSAYKR
eukprot:1181840-Prorocentrum_minimum.AAC.1